MTAHRASAPVPKRDEILTVRVPSNLAGEIRTLASATDDTVSRVVRQALRTFDPSAAANPRDLNSVRLPAALDAALERRCAALGMTRGKLGLFAATAFAELSDPAMREAIKPALRALVGAPLIRERLLSKGLLTPLMAVTSCPGRDCPIPSLRADEIMPPKDIRDRLVLLLQLPPAAEDAEILAAVQKCLDGAKGGPPPEREDETYARARKAGATRASTGTVKRGCGGACKGGAARAAVPAKAAVPAVTRETLCLHLGLDPARAYGSEIRRKAGMVASGSLGMNSSPAAAAALRAHLGLPAHCTEDELKSIVWSLTTPAGSKIVNPFAARLARQGK